MLTIREEASLWPTRRSTKKTVKEPGSADHGGELIEKPKAKTKTKKTTAKKTVKKKPKKSGAFKADILLPTKVVRKSVVKNEEHSDFEDSADLADDVEHDELDADDPWVKKRRTTVSNTKTEERWDTETEIEDAADRMTGNTYA